MNIANLIDGPSALIVFGGTAVATVLRAGASDCQLTLAKLRQLGAAAFDPERARSELAAQIQEIQKDGLLRAHPHHFGDSEFDEATDALINRRSVAALLEAHEAHRARRIKESDRAVRTLAQAAELSPVFGLAGTLVSLSQLPAQEMVQGSFTGAISMAVVTTLYGLLGANLLLAPLARIIERRAAAEEADRQAVIDWIAAQVEPATQPRSLRPVVTVR
ncbi:MAG: MotA/TolQ/ExbB proton channel family protein [Novosphingobium sp.]